MKAITIISSVVTFLLLLTAMVCGLWLKANGISAADSVQFHMASGIASFVFSFITMAAAIVWAARSKKGRAAK